MGVETALLVGGGLLAGVGAAGSIMSGHAANREAQTAAQLEALNAQIARQEIAEQKRVRTEEMTKLKETRKLAMLKSGMGLAGSPLLILEDTKRQLALEMNSLQYRSDLETYTSGLRQQNYLKSGRAALIGGYTKAAGQIGNFALGAMSPSPKAEGAAV